MVTIRVCNVSGQVINKFLATVKLFAYLKNWTIHTKYKLARKTKAGYVFKVDVDPNMDLEVIKSMPNDFQILAR